MRKCTIVIANAILVVVNSVTSVGLMRGAPPTIRSTINCSQAVPEPVDHSPIRSPQAVHTELARRIAGASLLEIGTARGDGMSCFAQVTSRATAIELRENYCATLRERSAGLVARGRGPGFAVVCDTYEKVLDSAAATADFIHSWTQPPMQNHRLLADVRAAKERGRVRTGTQVVLLYDMNHPYERGVWRACLRGRCPSGLPTATWYQNVTYDEYDLCKRMRKPTRNKYLSCDRARGTFVMAGYAM